jgi:hypothetical protein
MNFFKKMGKELGKQRTIDASVEKTLKSMRSGYRIVPSMEIKAWKAYLAVTFVAGFAAALIWGSYVSFYPVSRATGSDAVTLSVSSNVSSHKVGDEFPIQILLNTAEKNIVAVQAVFNYDKNSLQVVSVDISNSGFNYEIKNTIDANQGQGFLALAKPTPGANGAAVKVATVNLKALANINEPALQLKMDTFDAVSDSAAILDDGQGTNILRKLASIFPDVPVSAAPFSISSKASLADTVVRLDWSNGTVGSGNYIIERKIGKANFAKISEVGSEATSFIDRSAKIGKLYVYRVCQINNAGEKSCAPEQQVKTLGKKKILKPRFSAQIEEGKVRLNWTPTYPSDFRLVLQRRSGKQKKFNSFATASPDTNTYRDESVTSGVKYMYRLVVSVRGKTTQYSNNIKITVP